MERTIQVGDKIIITVGNQQYTLPITSISREVISAGEYNIIPVEGIWEVNGYKVPHSLRFVQGTHVPKVDNFSEFISEYRRLIQQISTKTMLKLMGEIDPDLVNAGICWMVTDNIHELLETKHLSRFDTSSDAGLQSYLLRELAQDNLLIVQQDPNSEDHWFALIGDHGMVHIVEHTEDVCNYHQTFPLNEAIQVISMIHQGTIPDRFYHVQGPHRFVIDSYQRKPLSRQSVDEYL